MSGAWLLVARREIIARITKRSFIIGTLLSVAIIVGLIGFTAWDAERAESYDLAATPEAIQIAEAVAVAAPEVDDLVKINVVKAPDDAAARRLVDAGEVDAWLGDGAADGRGWVLTTKSGPEDNLETVVAQAIRELTLSSAATAAGTTLAEMEAGSQVRASFLVGDAERAAIGAAVGFVFVVLFYTASLIFGTQLANSVVEEKQSRIVEIIAASIPTRQLLAGKLVGNTVLALGQILIYAAVGLIGLGLTSYAHLVPSLSASVLWFLAFFVGGFVALSSLWAVAGSLAARTEDVQNTSAPVTMLVMATFFGGLLLDGRWAVFGSFVPPLSAVLMPKRIVEGGVAWWEPVVALALLGVVTLITLWIGDRLYRRSLLQTQGRVSLRQAWTAPE